LESGEDGQGSRLRGLSESGDAEIGQLAGHFPIQGTFALARVAAAAEEHGDLAAGRDRPSERRAAFEGGAVG